MSDLATYPYHVSFCRFTVARRSSYGPICFDDFQHTLSDSVFVGDAKNLVKASLL